MLRVCRCCEKNGFLTINLNSSVRTCLERLHSRLKNTSLSPLIFFSFMYLILVHYTLFFKIFLFFTPTLFLAPPITLLYFNLIYPFIPTFFSTSFLTFDLTFLVPVFPNSTSIHLYFFLSVILAPVLCSSFQTLSEFV